MAGSPLTGAHPATVTWTLTETNGPADSYFWDFGDGVTATVSTNAAQAHSYAVAGSFRAKCTPSFNGVADTQIIAAAPAVIS
jgi:PKD repeat protein